MEHKRLLSISASILAAAWLASDTGSAMAQSKGRDSKINPDVNQSVGGSQSERTGESGTPLPEKSPYTGTVEKGDKSKQRSSSSAQGAPSKSRDSKKVNPDVNQSVGGSQSERTSESGTPLPEKSPYTGTVEKGNQSKQKSSSARGAPSKSGGSEKINPDVNQSVGGSQSERTGDSGTPLPKKSPYTGTVEKGTGGSGGSSNR